MIKNIDTDKPIDKAFYAVRDAMEAIGKLKNDNLAKYELKCKMRYGLQSMGVTAKLIRDQNSCSIKLEAVSDDAFQVGAKKVLAKLMLEIEKNLLNIVNSQNSNNLPNEKANFENSSSTKNTAKINDVFTPKTFRFDTEVTVKLTNDKVTATDGSSNASIDAKDIDNLTYLEKWEGKVSVGGFWFRFHGISALIAIASEMFFGGWSLGSFGVTLLLIIINVIFLLFVTIDSMFELRIIEGIIRRNFSREFYDVAIGNNSGNNIEFIAGLDERKKLEDLEIKLSQLKSNQKNIVVSKSEPIQISKTEGTNLDELKKLGELYQSGILTEDEFNNKKAKLLK